MREMPEGITVNVGSNRDGGEYTHGDCMLPPSERCGGELLAGLVSSGGDCEWEVGLGIRRGDAEMLR
jgi:hypothetical protein